MNNKFILKLYENNKEICEIKINSYHMQKGLHSKREIIDKMLERLENYLKKDK